MNTEQRIITQLAEELQCKSTQVEAAVHLLDGGATVPFIARYRKEATDGLDDTALRTLQERLVYLRELEERRASILESIQTQGKLSPELAAALAAATTKQTLEDLYLPYKPKRRTRAQIAREAGLQGLADTLLNNPDSVPEDAAQAYLNPEHNINDTKTALDGARDILAETFAEDAALLASLRERLFQEGHIRALEVPGKTAEKPQDASKFRDYFEHQEALAHMASHRVLALLRGREQGFLSLAINLPEVLAENNPRAAHPFETHIAKHWNLNRNESPRGQFLSEVCRWTWKIKLASTLENELTSRLRDSAQEEAITVFGKNLKDLLLAAPAGGRATMGLDPGIRTGVKVAVLDGTGQVRATSTVYPHEPRREWDKTIAQLAALCSHHQVELIAVGNGTASRETDQLAADMLARHPTINAKRVMVSEAGASVYSASALASQELPELDVSIRGAVSIARRLQDPLAELVKIDPKSIGVGQYQHDVDQRQLGQRLDAVVEDCVNAVGVEVNTASESLLARVSGLNSTVAKALVQYRNANGPFKSRAALKEVPRLGDKTFEQAAGFLRIHGADNPLDASSVHPEAYPVVEAMAKKANKPMGQIIGNHDFLKTVQAQDYTTPQFGLPTVQDILLELDKPGRDPRPHFQAAQFNEHVHTMADLKVDMVLEGVVTNVANFGAFVDIGVHQDGLVHISALAQGFVKDPHSVVKTGQIVRVKVLEVDTQRKRIALTMRLQDKAEVNPGRSSNGSSSGNHDRSANKHQGHKNERRPSKPQEATASKATAFAGDSAMALAFGKAKRG